MSLLSFLPSAFLGPGRRWPASLSTLIGSVLMLGALAWSLWAPPVPAPAPVQWQTLLASNGAPADWARADAAMQQQPLQRQESDQALNLGLRTQPVWLRVRVDAGPARWLLLGMPWLDRVDWQLQATDGQVLSAGQGGDQSLAASRRVPGEGLAIQLPALQRPAALLLRVQCAEPLVLRARWLDDEALRQLELSLAVRHAGLYGFLAALALFSLLCMVLMRERVAFYYAGYLGAFMLAHLGYTGQGLAWFWGPAVQRHAIGAGMVLFACFGPLCFLRLLELRQRLSWAWRGMRALLWLGLLLLPVMIIWAPQDIETRWCFGQAALTAVLALALRLLMLWKLPSVRPYLLLASVGGLGGGSITAAATWGWLDFTEARWRALEWGLAVEALLIAVMLVQLLRQQRHAGRQAHEQARRDPLTGLLNRRAFQHDARALWASAQPLSLIILDIDHFKRINDVHGHDAGDRALVAVAELLRANAASTDLVARWGGEEFVLLWPRVDHSAATLRAEQLRQALCAIALRLDDGSSLRLSASFGLAVRQEAEDLGALIACADQRLLRAKREGRNRLVCSDVMAVAAIPAAQLEPAQVTPLTCYRD